ncbi:MAG TPA: phosphoribosylformylglycinamidine synthase subunit PurL [Chitinophagales bacterium]|nr:phosphoribosylformylglycinamidine synthase subunit PurL [Chitinophagales bacterium]
MDVRYAEPAVTVKTAEALGLLPEEYEKIKTILGRNPNFTELSIFSVMWSEHCSYKNSIRWLKTLPRKGSRLLVEAGQENAGLVDIGDGLACAFKIESHNHPSAIEPYQGAATGVGGIHRDIFTMGARPVAALNSLRFGNISTEKTRHLVKGVVKGIGDYGNSFGVPTVAGEVYFEDCYEHNPLVNAMSVGIVRADKTISAIAKGTGNPVYIVGSATGKDGIHGATFASEEITDESHQDLPSVQVGDPFQEKLLLEATQELLETDAVIGMQDMGAAGITCSTSEMAAKGKHGMKIWLHKVPTRQENMKPFEILLSESQERMLVVVKKGYEETVEKIFDKWDLHCEIIGEVTGTGMLEYYMYDELVAHIPAESLVLGGGAPVYERPYKEPAYYKKQKSFNIDQVPQPANLREVAEFIIACPNIASKHWVYEQYDSMVGIGNLTTNAPADAALVRIMGTDKALALRVDCNARYVYADPYVGAMIAVAEAARNIICSGGTPVAITNCLNFGNPYNPEVYWQFVNAIKGMGEACRKFDTPVTGGNVSFYNQSAEGPVFPTPTIGMLGIVEHAEKRMTLGFKRQGDLIYLLGEPKNDINNSEYLVRWHNITSSPAPSFDLDEEAALHEAVKSLILLDAIVSAHDVSDGGLFVSLVESAAAGGLGFELNTTSEIRKDAFLFGESQSRAVVSVSPEKQELFEHLAANKYPYRFLGRVTEGRITVDGEHFGEISAWKQVYDTALEEKLGVAAGTVNWKQ